WENRDPKMNAIKHWVRGPLEAHIEAGRLRLVLFTELEEITADAVRIKQEDGTTLTLPNYAVFILIGADADFTLLRAVGVEIVPAGLTQVPVYDADTFETNVPGLYVAGHFTHARHIKQAIEVPRRIVPLIAPSLRASVQPSSASRAIRAAAARKSPHADNRPRAPKPQTESPA